MIEGSPEGTKVKNFNKVLKIQIKTVPFPQNRKVMITTAQPPTKEISTVDALWVLIQSQSKRVRQALIKRLMAEYKANAQQKMVTESLTRAFEELHAGKVHHDDRNLF